MTTPTQKLVLAHARHGIAAARRRMIAIRGARSQRAFARELGVTWHMLWRFEQGHLPSPSLLIALGQRGVRLDWLVFGEGPPTRAVPRAEDFAPISRLDFEPWETVEL